MKEELLWLDERMKEALTLPLNEQEDSVFYYIQHMKNRQEDRQIPPADYSLAYLKPAIPEAAAGVEVIDEEFSLDFDDFNFDFDLPTNAEHKEEVNNQEEKLPLIFSNEDQEFQWTSRNTWVFTDTDKFTSEYVFAVFHSFSNAQLFPPSFSFKNWMKNFRGRLYFVYHTVPRLYVLQDGIPVRINEDNFSVAFDACSEGIVVMGLPEPVLQMGDWCFRSFTVSAKEAGQEIILVKYPMERNTYKYISECQTAKLLLVFSEKEMMSLARQRLEHLSNVSGVLFSIDFHVRDLIGGMKQIQYRSFRRQIPQSVTITGAPFWRSMVNSWMNKQLGDLDLDDIFTIAAVDVCNEWWLSSFPKDEDIIPALFRCAKAYHQQIDAIKTELFKIDAESLYQVKNNTYKRVEEYFNEIVFALLGGRRGEILGKANSARAK